MSGIVLRCSTVGTGIRIAKSEDIIIDHLYADEGDSSQVMVKFYEAWWRYCRLLQIPVDNLLKADYSPIHFRFDNKFDGRTDIIGHGSIDRFSGSVRKTWQEQLWQGEFGVRLDGLAFSSLNVEDMDQDVLTSLAIRPFVFSFLRALNEGFIQVGGGGSIGHGFIKINNLNEAFLEFTRQGLSSPLRLTNWGRCKKGHFISPKSSSFGGSCKCGTYIVPTWTVPLESAYSEAFSSF